LPPLATPPQAPVPPVAEISYSSLEEHRRCGYRYYLERVLGVAPVQWSGGGGDAGGSEGHGGALSGAERGVIVHELLERLDFRRPAGTDHDAVSAAAGFKLARDEAARIVALVEGFAASETCARLGRATSVRSEQGFAFLLEGGGAAGSILFRGFFDAIAQERGGATLVVDYKTDQLDGSEPEDVVQRSYIAQRLIYALAALRAGARTVEVVHAFLERANEPAVASYGRVEVPDLEDALRRLTADMVEGRFPVSAEPHRSLCHGCPAEGGLCSWPLSATRRESLGQLF
jgi:hypothetical protein